jgi:hypothetical protein
MGEADEPRGAGLVARRRYLHRRNLQAGRKLTFFRGAAIEDPAGLFNSSLEGNVRRAIDIRENEPIDEAAFKRLITAAVAANAAARAAKKKK